MQDINHNHHSCWTIPSRLLYIYVVGHLLVSATLIGTRFFVDFGNGNDKKVKSEEQHIIPYYGRRHASW